MTERWDKLSDERRRRLSAELAAKEAAEQGLPPLASPEQHQHVAAILATTSHNGVLVGEQAEATTAMPTPRRTRTKRPAVRSASGPEDSGPPDPPQ